MSARGCFKFSCLGCLGLLAIGILIGGVIALLAWTGRDEQRVEEQALTGPAPDSLASGAVATPGRLVLEVEGGEFKIIPGRPGDSIKVEGRYDAEVHELSDRFELLPDSSWVYEVRFRRTMPALQALFRGLFGGDTETWVHVTIPPDVPLTLVLRAREGGLEGDLGGLWIREADLNFARGGFVLDVSKPLREPMESLTIVGRMGGMEVEGLGNASPRTLSVDQRMGGAEIDLRGPWARDCEIALSIEMGGMSVRLPQDVEIAGLPVGARGPELHPDTTEVPLPRLSFSASQSMGEIEFR